MMRLAIRGTGNKTTGKKLIETLEMLGGVNENGLLGDYYRCFYYIDDTNLICCEFEENMIVCHYQTHTLESFNDKYPYRPDDTVRLKDGPVFNVTGIRWSNGTIVYDGIITSYFIPLKTTMWPKDILHKIDNAPESDVNNKTTQDVNDEVIKYNYPIEGMYQIKKDDHIYYDVMDGYEVVEDSGAVQVKKIQPKYPTTYEECCKVLGKEPQNYTVDRKEFDFIWLQALVTCRDAYWKLADNWKPNWNEANDCIINWNNEIKCEPIVFKNVILAFPNEDMCDAFFENFKDMIERCKEFL